jgi:hypothetical protein
VYISEKILFVWVTIEGKKTKFSKAGEGGVVLLNVGNKSNRIKVSLFFSSTISSESWVKKPSPTTSIFSFNIS